MLEDDYVPLFGPEIKNAWSYTSIPQHVFISVVLNYLQW